MARSPSFGVKADGQKVVHELPFARSQLGIGVSVIDRAARYLRCC